MRLTPPKSRSGVSDVSKISYNSQEQVAVPEKAFEVVTRSMEVQTVLGCYKGAERSFSNSLSLHRLRMYS
ncbi:hypothetical protein Hanom_Chr00s000001g01595411 [Helianthus anomalus]